MPWRPKTEGESWDVVRSEFPPGTGAGDMAFPGGDRAARAPPHGRRAESSPLRGTGAMNILPCTHGGTGMASTWPQGAGGFKGTW